jgi:AcrR family transcriptional regulator
MAAARIRSDETRERIARAARRLFAEHGYERTTIRAVAGEAGIDPSMVMRYFGSKEGLFAAVSSFDLRLPDLAALPREAVGRALVRHFLARWEQGDDGLVVLLRAASSNEEARARMREIFASQVLPRIAGIAEDEAALRAELIASQILGLAFCRFVLRLPHLSGPDAEAVVERVGSVVQFHLFGAAR